MWFFGQYSTEFKTKKATDEDEKVGATGTLMNEISALTYNPKTIREITQVVRKRLAGHTIGVSHKRCIRILKTLTLVLYLINNGSQEFIAWVRGNLVYFERLRNCESLEQYDESLARQVQSMSNRICDGIVDDELLEDRKRDITEFRSSISSPGRKFTDNSHLKDTLQGQT